MAKTTPQLPSQFGPYYLFDLIGKGGMAEIFLAKTYTSLGTERLCVIKRILPHLNEDTSFCEMLIKEAKLCSQLSHANVVQTNELGQIDGQFYIAMEYVEGVDLNRLLGLLSRAKISLPLQFAVYIIIEALRGLDYAHRLKDDNGKLFGIIHSDVSPTNVLISSEGDVKLCDFGIAKVALDDVGAEHRLDEYHMKGKVAYMAPEHVAGAEIDCRADLFAAGILMWELLSGRRLYKTKDEHETFRRAKTAQIPPLVDRKFPKFEMLSRLVQKALSRNPDDRFQSGQEFIQALEDYMHSSGQVVSHLRFSNFLMDNFGESLMAQRRERERQLAQLMDLHDPISRRDSIPAIPVDGSTGIGFSLKENPITASLLAEEYDDDELVDEMFEHAKSIPPRPPLGGEGGQASLGRARRDPNRSVAVGSVRLDGTASSAGRAGRIGLIAAGIVLAIAGTAAVAYFLGFI